ncbi:MAG: 6-pyruvoyl-tetrahydropterin synthase-related protein, partial [Patescibacteria group bacterium]|nr:6-pyruvoyl-tetrahydropterin synthase-related protein [Patescibacteria group bacterium]
MKKKVVAFLLILIFLGSSWSLLNNNFFRVHDYTSGARIAEMTRALEDGHFPVRWTKNFGYGYGMPLFEFYGPLPFYVGSIFYWLTNNLVGSIKFLYLLSNLGTVIGAYLLGKEFAKRRGGVLAAALITLAPYRALNLFIRGALNETWGLIALPWILWSLTKIVKGKNKYWPHLTLSLLLMVLSHNLTVLIAAPFIFLYLLILVFHLHFDKKIKLKLSSFFSLFWAGLMSLMISCFYWLPSYAEKSFTKMEELILTGYFDFRLHFLYLRQFVNPRWGFGGSSWGPNDNISFFLGYGQIFVLVGLGVFFVINLLQAFRRKEKLTQVFQTLALPFNLLIVFLFATLLTTPKTRIIWEKISLMKYIQFPWRYMVIMILLISLLGAILLGTKFKKCKKLNRSFFALVLVLSLFNARFFHPQEFLT